MIKSNEGLQQIDIDKLGVDRLSMAIVERAVLDYVEPTQDQMEDKILKARSWLYSEERDYVFSFRKICKRHKRMLPGRDTMLKGIEERKSKGCLHITHRSYKKGNRSQLIGSNDEHQEESTDENI